ncbi:cytochrome P460 family protein [Peribacillus butanolivorans]|uniref:cytochrome P460 family protein n=1 Tax=Peribacillus butanolivorans TaxID=421767 RepID=UPI002E209326|nr:cytochrome P460 family protein [Peribacillus butanolivorans]
MKKLLFTFLALVMPLTLTACNNNNDTNGISQQEPSGDTSQQEMSEFSRELVEFPKNYDKGVNYTTVNRGNVREELYTSQKAIEAVQNDQPIPDGTVITLEIYRDEKLDEIFVMEKRDGWVDQNPSEMRNGDWLYQEFNGDKSVDYEEDIGRCFSCHANQERDDFVNTLDEMKKYDLEDFTGSKDSSTESKIAGIPINHWEVKALDDNLEASRDILNGNSLMEDEEKVGIIQKVLLMIHFNQET